MNTKTISELDEVETPLDADELVVSRLDGNGNPSAYKLTYQALAESVNGGGAAFGSPVFFDPSFVVRGNVSCDYLPCDCCFWRATNYISSNVSHFTWNGVQFGYKEANFEFMPVFGVDSTNNAYALGAPRPLYAKQGDSLYTA